MTATPEAGPSSPTVTVDPDVTDKRLVQAVSPSTGLWTQNLGVMSFVFDLV